MKRKNVHLISIVFVIMVLMGMTTVGAYATDESTATTTEKCTITIEANNGTNEKLVHYNITVGHPYFLPNCSFTVPEGMSFGGWNVYFPDGRIVLYSGDGNFKPQQDTTVKAHWTGPVCYAGATVTVPEYGATPNYTGIPNDPTRYGVKDVNWFKVDGTTFTELKESDTFEEGTYAVEVAFDPDEEGFSNEAEFTINNEPATKVNDKDGYVYAVSFDVTKPADGPSDDPASGDTDKDDTDTDKDTDKPATDGKSPQTSDTFNVHMWIVLMIVGALSMFATYTYRRD